MKETTILKKILKDIHSKREISIWKRHKAYYRGYSDGLYEAYYLILCELLTLSSKSNDEKK